MLEKTEKFNHHLDQYEQLLTDKQRQVAFDYYQEDLSLQEIADNQEVSKNAIYDTLKRTEALLLDYENKLKLVQKDERLNQLFNQLSDLKIDSVNQLIKQYQEENYE